MKKFTQMVDSGWNRLGKLLGFINNHIILFIIYVIIIIPVSWLYKITNRKRRTTDKSIWIDRKEKITSRHFDKTW